MNTPATRIACRAIPDEQIAVALARKRLLLPQISGLAAFSEASNQLPFRTSCSETKARLSEVVLHRSRGSRGE
jgi:hypothetical protein